MSEEQAKVVHDFLFRRAGKKAYNLGRLKAQTELAKLHREEFLELVHKHKSAVAPKALTLAERHFQALTPDEISAYYERILQMQEYARERQKAKRQYKLSE